MTKSKTLLLIIFLAVIQVAVGQPDKNTYAIIQISPVYESGLVSYTPDPYLLVSKKFDENFKADIFFARMAKKKFWKQSDLIDSVSKDFNIYSIKFDSVQKQVKQSITDQNNFGNSFLIPLMPEVSGVKAYLITLFSRRIDSLQYQVVKKDCSMHWEDCEVKISSINF
jgi:hypothetical protein